MENLLEILNRYDVEKLINTNSTKLLHKDTVYLNDIKDLCELELQYENLDLSFCQRALINDYIACMQTAQSRANDCSYITGIIDAIQILHSLNMLKTK